ncbi:MAG: hypothetical protein VX127_16815 [Myxococcota bacterium]|nr:hypothetical protein [Myxococcota bacterium]
MHLLAALFCAFGIGTASAAEDESTIDFDMEGYYRTRGYVFKELFAAPMSGPGGGTPAQTGRYMTQRLRLQPSFSFEKRAKLTMMADVMDDVVWGDNASLSSTALFASDPSNTAVDGQESQTFKLKRAWMEFDIPVGKIRVGRQPSNWGLGLLANDGNGFDDLFGENHGGSTFDRFMFATRPLAIVQTALGKDAGDTPLFFVVGVDRLVEDSKDQYYGYNCTENPAGGGWVQGEDSAYDERCDLVDYEGNPGRDGVTDTVHDYTEERDAAYRSQDWWADNHDDVKQMIYALIYRGEGVSLAGRSSDLTLGVYTVHRTQDETNSDVWILDAYGHLLWGSLLMEGEVLNIRGTSSAIALPGAFDPNSELDNPLQKDVDIWGYVARLGYETASSSAIFETGYASGDENVIDDRFTGRPIHSDYNVGLLIYDEILSRVTAANYTDSVKGLWSKGGVYNSRYIYPHLKFRPAENLELRTAYLLAWPDKPDGTNVLCAADDELDGEPLECASTDASDSHLGWELNVGVHHDFHQHIKVALEAAWAETSDRIPLERAGLNPSGKFFTMQARAAFEF